VLAWIQIEHLCPGRWPSLIELSAEIGAEVTTMSRVVNRLARINLIRYSRFSRRGPLWIWWVKSNAADQPDSADEPGWWIRKKETGETLWIAVSNGKTWGRVNHFAPRAIDDFLSGRRPSCCGDWEVMSFPFEFVTSTM